MRTRWTALLLALCMLVCAGCGGGEEKNAQDPLPEPDMEVIRTPQAEDEVPEPSETEPEPEPEPEPVEEPLTWTTDPVLSAEEMPGSYYGLELPVRGATGYTSVELPLWEAPEDYMSARQAVSDWEAQQAAWQAAAAESEASGEGGPEPAEDASGSGASASLDVLSDAAPEDTEPVAPEDVEPDSTAPEGETPDMDAAPADDTDIPSDEEPQPDSEGETPPENETEPAPDSGEETEPPAETEEPVDPPSLTDGALAILPPGTPMIVLDESDQWWQVRCTARYTTPEGKTVEGLVTGWVQHRYCFINLPDVIPSIVYNATNGYSSRFISCGKNIDGITGEQLYTGRTFNRRLGEEEFMMPVLYSMSFRLCEAQQAALREGNTIVLYEGYRPMETQMQVANGLRALMKIDPEVQAAITAKPWNISWFIATSTSNHQWGYAVDVSLARVKEVEVRQTGEYSYTRVTSCEEYEMPTPIHELSPAAATFTTPVGSNSTTAWKSATLTDTMAACEPALGLQRYCTDAKLSPLASEWWHFNDLASRSNVLDHPGSAGFEITECLSEGPYRNIA